MQSIEANCAFADYASLVRRKLCYQVIYELIKQHSVSFCEPYFGGAVDIVDRNRHQVLSGQASSIAIKELGTLVEDVGHEVLKLRDLPKLC